MPDRPPARVALDLLRDWRVYREWSQETLGEKARLTPAAISKLETGQAKANPVTVFKLMRALGITRQQLLEQGPPQDWLRQQEDTEGEKKEVVALA
jgi:transcriptional regulator with XRE-family HTH domain